MKKRMTMLEGFIEIGRKQVDIFANNHEVYLNCIVVAAGMRHVMMQVYKSLVYSKRLAPLEDQPREEKLHVWETAKEISAGRLDKEGQTQLSKVLYTIEYYLNN